MRGTKEHSEVTHQALLDAALQVFSRKGYAAARMEDIARAAGVTRGAIYRQFGSKAALFSGLVAEAAQLGTRAVQDAVQTRGTSGEKLSRITTSTLRLIEEDARFRAVMALVLLNPSDTRELSSLRDLRSRLEGDQERMIAAIFTQGLRQGTVRPDLDSQIAARAFLAFQNGLILTALSSQAAPDLVQQSGLLAEVFIRGISRGPN